MLVWDAFAGHITPGVKEQVRGVYNSDMAVIPGGCTSKLQPCDVSWNRPFKDNFRDMYDEWLVDGVVDLTRGGNRRAPTREQQLIWIKQAWDSVTPEVIKKSFRVCGVTLAGDGTEDDQLFRLDDSSDDDDFEGFTAGDAEAAAQLHENVAAELRNHILDGDEYSEADEEDDFMEDDGYCHPDSPGH